MQLQPVDANSRDRRPSDLAALVDIAPGHQKNIKVVRVAPGALIKGGEGYQGFIKMLAAPSVNLLF
ncbi:TPA: hypothetical protein RQM97_000185 [Aeromonas dhakensis]|nr:hypothetical protein [Aeromonas dhakensis]